MQLALYKTKLSMTIGALLKQKRKEKGMTQEDVGNLFGWSSQYYARFEKDQILPTEYNCKKIASFLEKSPSEVIKLANESRK